MQAFAGRGSGEVRGEVAMPHGGGAVAGGREEATWRVRIGPGAPAVMPSGEGRLGRRRFRGGRRWLRQEVGEEV